MNRKHLISLTVILAFSGISLLKCQSWIRINQLGYLPASVKVAVLVSKDRISLTEFELHNALSGKILYKSDRIQDFGAYGAFESSFRLDFSDYVQQGPVYLAAAGVKSPVFNISERVYDGTADFLLHYMRQQRCGYNPFLHD